MLNRELMEARATALVAEAMSSVAGDWQRVEVCNVYFARQPFRSATHRAAT